MVEQNLVKYFENVREKISRLILADVCLVILLAYRCDFTLFPIFRKSTLAKQVWKIRRNDFDSSSAFFSIMLPRLSGTNAFLTSI